MLEHLVVEGQIGDQLLEPPVLVLQSLQPLGLLGLRPAVLVPPAVVGRFADL